jgi:MoaA/NifB/PqqE/SkfB family radical SAM enzyme
MLAPTALQPIAIQETTLLDRGANMSSRASRKVTRRESRRQRVVNKLRFVRRLLGPARLKYGVLLLTSRCNLACPYCSVTHHATREMSFAEWIPVVERLSGWGVAHFNLLGGEPLVRQDLVVDLTQYISSVGGGVTLTTNGILLREDMIDSLAQAGLFMLIVSGDTLNGSEPKGNFERSTELLSYARSRGIVPVLHSVITSSNVKSVYQLARLTVSKDILFSCSVYQAVGGSQSCPNPDLVPEVDSVVQAFRQIAKLKRETGMVRTTFAYMENYERYHAGTWHCDINDTKWLAVQSDGRLMICAEWELDQSVLKTDWVPSNAWKTAKSSKVQDCPGCYYECYYSQQEVFGPRGLINEVPKASRFWIVMKGLLLANLKPINQDSGEPHQCR